jgi:hypothetical protein
LTGPPGIRPFASTSPSVIGQLPEVYEIRWPDGRRFSNRRKVTAHEAHLLVQGCICDEVRSPTGILRYLRMRRNPPMRMFASLLAQADFTVTRTANLHEHKESKRKGL